MKPDGAQEEPIFKWDTLREVGQETLRYQMGYLPGKVYEVELTSRAKSDGLAWRRRPAIFLPRSDLRWEARHLADAVSPYGKEIPTILRGHYDPVPEHQTRPGDIVVFRGTDADEVVHSAVLTSPVVAQGQNYLAYSTRVQSKNGVRPEANLTLEAVILAYGESYNTYRRR